MRVVIGAVAMILGIYLGLAAVALIIQRRSAWAILLVGASACVVLVISRMLLRGTASERIRPGKVVLWAIPGALAACFLPLFIWQTVIADREDSYLRITILGRVIYTETGSFVAEEARRDLAEVGLRSLLLVPLAGSTAAIGYLVHGGKGHAAVSSPR